MQLPPLFITSSRNQNILILVFPGKLEKIAHCQNMCISCYHYIATDNTDRQTNRYFIDRKKVITDLFVIEMKEIYVHVYTRFLI